MVARGQGRLDAFDRALSDRKRWLLGGVGSAGEERGDFQVSGFYSGWMVLRLSPITECGIKQDLL